ncbi:MAG: DUF503 domain-containing protein [Chloroflexota bacterium]
MPIGVLTLHLHLPGCTSLKAKRQRLKPLLARLHREFNISVAEMDCQDVWQNAVIVCALVSNDNGHTQRTLQQVHTWIETHWPDVSIIGDQLDTI